MLQTGSIQSPSIKGVYSILIVVSLLSGCASDEFGRSLLADLREQGLLGQSAGEPVPIERHPADGTAPMIEGSGPVTLDDLFLVADRENPHIQAARAAIGSAGGRTWQTGMYPNPSLEIEIENIRPSNGNFGRSESTISIAQPFPAGDRRRAEVAAGLAEMDVLQCDVAAVRLMIHGAIRRHVTEIAFLLRSIELHESVLQLAERTVEIAEKRFEVRAAAESEVIRARVERTRLALEIDRLRGELASAGVRLQEQLGGRFVEPHRLEFSFSSNSLKSLGLPEDLDVLKSIIETSHPAVRASGAAVRQSERLAALERARVTPDITGRLGIGVDHGSDEAFFEAGIGVPLMVFDRNRGGILAARFDVIRRKQEAEALIRSLQADLGDAFHRWQSASKRHSQFSEALVGDAQRAFDQTRVGYDAGHLSFIELLDAQRSLTDAKITQLELEREVEMALADIRAIVSDPRDDERHSLPESTEPLMENMK